MSYENATATKLLATKCCCCGRPHVDSISVELGIGPESRNGTRGGISKSAQEACNRLTHHASLLATQGNIEGVREVSEEVKKLGLIELAEKINKRFVNAERLSKIQITQNGNVLSVKTPFKRSLGEDFKIAWREIPGRRWNSKNKTNDVPVESKRELWNLLTRFFPGEYGRGPQGVFKIPE